MTHRIKITLIAGVSIFSLMGNVFAGESMVGQQAPKITVSRWLTANPPTTESLEGKVYVIEFWTTWCPHCVRIIPRINQLTNKYAGKEVFFIALSEDKSQIEVKKMISEKKINYCVGMDSGTNKRFKSTGFPTIFVIDHTGTVVWRGHYPEEEFEEALAKALEKAPTPFLQGAYLGPFEDFRLDLSGGNSFAKAYQQLKTRAQNINSQDSKLTAEIIDDIESRINKKVEEANNLQKTDPATALELYHRIVKNYAGAAATVPAQAAYDKLKNDPNVQNELAALEALRRADRLIARCAPCQNCRNFSSVCPTCIELNQTTVTRVVQLLTSICNDYKDTKAAKTARQKLTQFAEERLQTHADANDSKS